MRLFLFWLRADLSNKCEHHETAKHRTFIHILNFKRNENARHLNFYSFNGRDSLKIDVLLSVEILGPKVKTHCGNTRRECVSSLREYRVSLSAACYNSMITNAWTRTWLLSNSSVFVLVCCKIWCDRIRSIRVSRTHSSSSGSNVNSVAVSI